MSRITTSSASFSGARAAMRRACSSEVRAGSVSFVRDRGQCIHEPRTSTAPVETPLLDQPGHGLRHEAVERLPRGRGRPDVPGGGRMWLDVEEDDPVAPPQAGQEALELLPREAGPRRDREA